MLDLKKKIEIWVAMNDSWLINAECVLTAQGLDLPMRDDLLIALLEVGLCTVLETDPDHSSRRKI